MVGSVGLAAVGLANCKHVGRLGEWVELAAAEGVVGLAFANGAHPGGLVTPYGSLEPFFGTNPVAAGVPVTGDDPIVVDFATSMVAEGKVRVARNRGESLPEGLIQDKRGRPTTDPHDLYDGGTLLTIAAHKGSALSLLGDASRLAGPAIAMVGMRNGSAVGRKFARGLAADLGAAGIVVVSGMARGIDGAAHEGSLATGSVAVLAGGVDIPYPRENEALYRRLVEHGAAVSDQPLGTAPTARHFPPRNRIIAGLSLGVVVVEANLRSGSLITARLANEQGRVVFAVPGSPLDPRAAGPNDLLRQGAVLVERADDVIAAVEGMARPALAPARKAPETAPAFPQEVDEGTRGAVVDRLAHTPLTVDELVRECQLSAASVQTVLLELELAGRVVRQPGNRVSLIT